MNRKDNSLSTTKFEAFVGLFIVLSIVVLIVTLRNRLNHKITPPPSTIVTTTENSVFPPSWNEIAVAGDIVSKVQKQSSDAVKPTVVLSKHQIETTDPKVYVDRLLKGAVSAIPSLKVTGSQESTSNGSYSRTIEGYYFNARQKIAIRQQVVIKNKTIYTLTASYRFDSQSVTRQEIDTVFTRLYDAKIK